MRFLICSMNYSPEMTGIGRYSGEMAEWLAGRGHSVMVICSQPYYPDWCTFKGYVSWKYKSERINGVEVLRCPLWVPKKPTGMTRILHLLSYSVSSFFVTIAQSLKKPNIIITVEPPILTAPAALIGAKISGAKSVLHVQDFEVDAAVTTGLIKANKLVKAALYIEKYLLKKYTIVSTISHSMINKLKTKGLDKNRIVHFPNWVDTDIILPSERRSVYRDILGISDEIFVVLYSGNIGKKQGIDILLDVANKLCDKKNILFVVAGGGVGKDEFFAKARKLDNIICMPLQPENKLPDLLNLADVHILPMLEGTDELVMPSKLGNMLSSGRPVIVTANAQGEIAKFVSGSGIIVPFGDIEKIVESIINLVDKPDFKKTLGQQARKTVLNKLEKNAVLTDVESVFERLYR